MFQLRVLACRRLGCHIFLCLLNPFLEVRCWHFLPPTMFCAFIDYFLALPWVYRLVSAADTDASYGFSVGLFRFHALDWSGNEDLSFHATAPCRCFMERIKCLAYILVFKC